MNRNDTTETVRDEQLGELLRELDVPEHRPEFHAALRRRLHDERRSARRGAALRWSLRGAAVVAAAAVVVAIVGLPAWNRSPSLSGPQVANAALVKVRVRAAVDSLRALSGVLVSRGPGAGDEARFRFALDAAGDLRLEGPRPGDVETYDAASGIVRSAQHSASMGGAALFYAERDGVAPGPPDQGPPSWLLPERYGAYVRALLAAGSPAVRSGVEGGRPVWLVDVSRIPNAVAPELSGDHLRITVDRRSGMPVQIVETKHGTLVSTLRIDDLTLDPAFPADEFRLAFPAGAEVMRGDDGFQTVPLDDAADTVGYPPLVPSWVPAGYELADVAVARESTAAGDGNPASRMVVSLSYRRGLDRFLVTTRLRGDGPWRDPLASPPGFVDTPEHVALTTGALAGADAQLVLSPNTVPHVWTLTHDLVVTVGGDLSRQELVRVAGSLGER